MIDGERAARRGGAARSTEKSPASMRSPFCDGMAEDGDLHVLGRTQSEQRN
jgi:hypothetical protein